MKLSKPLVGSSKNRIDGSVRISVANERRRRSPPERQFMSVFSLFFRFNFFCIFFGFQLVDLQIRNEKERHLQATAYVNHRLLNPLASLFVPSVSSHPEKCLKKQVLANSQRVDEYVVLLHVGAHRCDVLECLDRKAVDSYRAVDFQRSAIPQV